MWKTSGSTESIIRPEKGEIKVGSDGGDDGSHDNKHSPRGSGRAHQWIHQLAWPRLWIEFDGVDAGGGNDGKWVKKLSKS